MINNTLNYIAGIFFLLGCTIIEDLSAQKVPYSLGTDFNITYEELCNGFISPPSESRLRCYWWWLNGMATKKSITRDLEEMKAKGYGGAAIVDAGSSDYSVALKTSAGPVFLSQQWIELYQHAIQEADRLGLELSVNLGSGWNPGGPDITPEYALKKLVWSEMNVSGGKEIRIILPKPEWNLMYQDICVQALPKTKGMVKGESAIKNWDIKTLNKSIGWKGIYPLYKLREEYEDPGTELAIKRKEILDLTHNLDGDILSWKAPAGEWTIIRYGFTCTGVRTSTTSDGWNGFSMDHLSKEAFAIFNQKVVLPLIKSAQAAGNSLHFLQTDSWEMGVANWTDSFADEFVKDHGYSLVKFMPVLTGRIVESRALTNRFLHDFRQTVGNCIKRNHYQLMFDVAHQYGLGICPESGGPHSAPVDALDVMSVSDFPQGEFWAKSSTHRITDAERFSVKQSACVAHTNGKRFVAAEGPTSIGPHWERAPKDIKSDINRVFCSGVNRIVWHTFTSSPSEFGLPGNEYFAGTHLNPNTTWWEMAGSFIEYINRCSFMLQQGLFVADVLYYYGDDVPNFVFLKEEVQDLPPGYDWDKCSRNTLLNRVGFDGRHIVLPDGMSYRILVLPDEKSIDLEVLKKIKDLVNAGMTVLGPPPASPSGLSGYPESDRELKKIVKMLWGRIDGINFKENHFGKGKVIWGKSIGEILTEMNISPDFRYASARSATSLDYIHRCSRDLDIYFVVNCFEYKAFSDYIYRYIPDIPDRYEQADCYFRVKNKVPEVWDPVTGKRTEVTVYRQEGDYTIVPLHFVPGESKFIVFRNNDSNKHIIRILKDGHSAFPAGSSDVAEFPLYHIEKQNQAYNLTLLEPGTYSFIWSDGTRNEIVTQHKPKITDISKGWTIYFDTLWGGPGNVSADALKSWTDYEDNRIRYYSGKAVYVSRFSYRIDPGKVVFIDLGNVQELASVSVNGNTPLVLWKAPFRIEISDYLKTGENELRVEVINLWPNRLIGDSMLEEGKRFTRTNVRKFSLPGSERFLRVSGLLGPVKLIALENKVIP